MCLMVLGTKNFETIRKSSIGIDRAEREGCLLPERQEDGSRRKQKIIFYMKIAYKFVIYCTTNNCPSGRNFSSAPLLRA